MIKIVFVLLLILGMFADIVLVVLKCTDVIDWSWLIIAAIPFAIAIAGTLVFALFYLIIKLFVMMAIGWGDD